MKNHKKVINWMLARHRQRRVVAEHATPAAELYICAHKVRSTSHCTKCERARTRQAAQQEALIRSFEHYHRQQLWEDNYYPTFDEADYVSCGSLSDIDTDVVRHEGSSLSMGLCEFNQIYDAYAEAHDTPSHAPMQDDYPWRDWEPDFGTLQVPLHFRNNNRPDSALPSKIGGVLAQRRNEFALCRESLAEGKLKHASSIDLQEQIIPDIDFRSSSSRGHSMRFPNFFLTKNDAQELDD